MCDDDCVAEGLEQAYRDGFVRVEQPAPDFDDAQFSLSEHGEARARDLLREKPEAVALMVSMAIQDADDYPEALFKVGKKMAEDAGVNLYRVIQDHPDLFPWLTEDAISDEMVAGMEEYVDE